MKLFNKSKEKITSKVIAKLSKLLLINCFFAYLCFYPSNKIFALESIFSGTFKSTTGELDRIALEKLNNIENANRIQSWIKYFKYNPGSIIKNKNFIINKEYNAQSNDIKNLSDTIGSIGIPSQKHFFAILSNNKLDIYTNRIKKHRSNFDFLNLNYIEDVFEDGENSKSGIKNLKKYDEGYCFEVITRKPKNFFQMSTTETFPNTNIKEIWFFCGNTLSEAEKLMNALVNQRIKLQQKVGVYRTLDAELHQSEANDNPLLKNDRGVNTYSIGNKPTSTNEESDINGYWVLLKDWNECSLKCGGGTQTQQLLCVPPKGNGKPCFGPSIRKRSCNLQPCQEYPEKSITDLQGYENKVKVLSISDIPLKYDKCYLKESNALMITSLPIPNEKQPLLVRLVMNNNSINAYKVENGEILDPLLSFDLQESIFNANILDDVDTDNQLTQILMDNFPAIVTTKRFCFKLSSKTFEAAFCKISTQSNNEFVAEWQYDYGLFKNQCQRQTNKEKFEQSKKLEGLDEEKNEKLSLEEEFGKKVRDLKVEIIKEKGELIELHQIEENKLNLRNKIEEAENESLMKLEKEARMESLLELEESVKEKEDTETLEQKVESEKKKEECLLKAFEEKALEEQVKLDESRTETRIQEIDEETVKQLQKKREEIKRRILKMRKKNERKQKELVDKIVFIRTEMANKINQLARKGNISKCLIDPVLEKSKRLSKEYCMKIKIEKLRIDCLQPGGFCYTCCENEIGEAFIKDREECYDNCDKLIDKKN